MKFYIVDAFTEELFGGNPAGVVILEEGCEFPSDSIMQKTAAELRYSETAFIKPLVPDQFQLRYFTPVAEVELCGHATIASFAALADAGLTGFNAQICTARTLAGDLRIKLDQGLVMMEMGAPQCLGKIQAPGELEELYSTMGLTWPVQVASLESIDAVLLPQIISTGLPDIILPVKDRSTLNGMQPNFPALIKLSQKYQVTGVHAFALDGCSSEVTAHCRNFAPLFGIDEEATTGTASGALTHYLYTHQLITRGQSCTFIQGEAIKRPSKIRACVDPQDDRLIRVGGRAKILAQGMIHL